MNNRVVFALFQAFQKRGSSVLRFNFRGVGRFRAVSTAARQLSDAAAALDWMQTVNPNASGCWIGGYSFGAWIGMQLLMRHRRSTVSSRSRCRRGVSISLSSPRVRHPG